MLPISYYIKNPSELANSLLKKTLLSKILPPALFLKLRYYLTFKKSLDLKNPKSFNEKLQWMKLYDHNPLYTTMVDKYTVKKFVADRIGAQYIIPSYGLWNNPNEIDFDSLPQQFVLKTTNGGGNYGVMICKDKLKINIDDIKSRLSEALKQDIYRYNKEWPYKNVPHQILAEQYIEPNEGENEIHDYKVLCFDGKPRLIEFHSGRNSGVHTQEFLDTRWNSTEIEQPTDPRPAIVPPKPEKLDEMLRLSEILAEGLPHVRVDWYYVRGRLYFGELTFFDGGGFCPFSRYEDDLMLGSWITLPPKNRS